MQSCELQFCAENRYQNAYRIGAHTHPCWELVYYLEGKGTTTIQHQKHSFAPNTFAIIPPNCTHVERGSAQTKIIHTGFLISDNYTLHGGLYAAEDFPILDVLQLISKEMRMGNLYSARILNILLEAMIIILCRPQDKPTEIDRETMITYAKNYLRLNYMNHVKIKDLAASIGYSYDYFRHVFLEEVGMTAKDFLMQEQLSHAKQQLLEGKNIKDIAIACGYASDAHFCNLFRRMTGQTPGEYVSLHTITKYPQISFLDEES